MSLDNIEDLYAAIDWEGSIGDLIDYGIKELPEHFDSEIREAWEDIVSSWEDYEDRVDYFHRCVKRILQDN